MGKDSEKSVSAKADSRPYFVMVVELSDDAGPRGCPDLPHLRVGKTLQEPEERFAQLRRGDSSSVGRHGVRLRPELAPTEPLAGAEAANRVRSDLVRSLRADGYTVNGWSAVWSVYVIRLDDAAGPRVNPSKPVVYVGQTSRPVEVRHRQHLDGATGSRGQNLASRVVHRHGRELLPELYEHLNPIWSQARALEVEKDLAAHLSAEGYTVRGGH